MFTHCLRAVGKREAEGLVASMRMKWLRDGVEDYDYVEMLKELGKRDTPVRGVPAQVPISAYSGSSPERTGDSFDRPQSVLYPGGSSHRSDFSLMDGTRPPESYFREWCWYKRRAGHLAKVTTCVDVLICCGAAIAQSSGYFTIRVLDERTGRGVPLVELLRGTSGIRTPSFAGRQPSVEGICGAVRVIVSVAHHAAARPVNSLRVLLRRYAPRVTIVQTNGTAERRIGSCRWEMLNHVIVLNQNAAPVADFIA
jgi:hypothetical protein